MPEPESTLAEHHRLFGLDKVLRPGRATATLPPGGHAAGGRSPKERHYAAARGLPASGVWVPVVINALHSSEPEGSGRVSSVPRIRYRAFPGRRGKWGGVQNPAPGESLSVDRGQDVAQLSTLDLIPVPVVVHELGHITEPVSDSFLEGLAQVVPLARR